MKTENKILILTDFTQTCYDSVSYSLELCKCYGLKAVVFHVQTGTEVFAEQRDRTVDIVRLYNSKFNIGATLEIKKGSLTETVLEEVGNSKYLFVILGTHGKSGFQALTGSFAAKIITALKIPILVVQSRKFVPFEKIVLPVFSSIKVDENFDDIIPFAEVFRTKIEIVCRQKGIDNVELFISKYFGKCGCEYGLTVFKDGGDNFYTQLINFCLENNAGIIFNYPSKMNNLQFDGIFEKLMFNIQQIPILCKYL
jgi:hypothetical protein